MFFILMIAGLYFGRPLLLPSASALVIGMMLGPLSARAQQSAMLKRIAFVSPSRKVSEMSLSGPPHYRAFFEKLSRLGYVEGQNLGVKRYFGGGQPERYAELVRDVVKTHPDLDCSTGR
jgi:putative ABC transport system substrate-binding protein